MSLAWQEPQTDYAKVKLLIGEKLVEADVVRMQISALEHQAWKERWQESRALYAVAALIGAVIGCVLVIRYAAC